GVFLLSKKGLASPVLITTNTKNSRPIQKRPRDRESAFFHPRPVIEDSNRAYQYCHFTDNMYKCNF
ncbi:hypothetical protein, partial [Lacticaseibacillus baoqingensis]|uniref:hypothetical protein n=1 Tax=Lacticaseibacillus baoqingensis TaxID=2486013 RepID=UPI001CDBD365